MDTRLYTFDMTFLRPCQDGLAHANLADPFKAYLPVVNQKAAWNCIGQYCHMLCLTHVDVDCMTVACPVHCFESNIPMTKIRLVKAFLLALEAITASLAEAFSMFFS